jgi:hypothetical protein
MLPLIAFHFGKTGLIAPVWIPVLYSLAMAAEATLPGEFVLFSNRSRG